MQSSQILQENLLPFEMLTPIMEGQNADVYAFGMDARQLYQCGMEDIRGKICGVGEGQDRVVMSQLWEFGKKSQNGAIHRAPTRFPALVAHGFIVERMLDGYALWEPYTPCLKDFWLIGIHVSNGHGFLLQPEHVFRANIQATLQMSM